MTKTALICIKVVIVLQLLFILALGYFFTDIKMEKYYSDKSNYVSAAGTVTEIHYSKDETCLFLSFSDLDHHFEEDTLNIFGDNLLIVRQNGIDEKIKIGDRINFIAAPKIWGDGYCVPIVGISVDGEELLDFEEGYTNLLKSLND